MRVSALTHSGPVQNRSTGVSYSQQLSVRSFINNNYYSNNTWTKPRGLDIVFRELSVPILKHLGVRETARRTGHGVGAVSTALNRNSAPRPAALARYISVAVDHARTVLADSPEAQTADATAVLRAAVEHILT
jgi:hypothetical protein